jgi:autotransporter-associated beta strand protein
LTGPNGFRFFQSANAWNWVATLNNATVNPNDYVGNTTIASNQTTVQLGAAEQIPNGSSKGNLVFLAPSTTGTLDLNGFSETINGLSGAGTIDNVANGTTNTLTIGDGDATGLTFSGVIRDTTGTLSIVKTGGGTQTLAGANDYSGNTTVNAGTLTLGNGTTNTSLADGADVIVAGGATLNLNYSAANVDTVGTLTINGVQKAAGIWGAPGSGAPNTDAQISGTGYLDVQNGPSGSDYNAWGAPYGLSEGSEGGDLDGDGLTNFEEYAFGLIPNSGASVNPISQQLNKGTGTFKYTRRATPASTGVTYTYESSTTLSGTWPGFTPVLESSNNATPIEEITVTVPASLLAEPKLFLRVKAVK